MSQVLRYLSRNKFKTIYFTILFSPFVVFYFFNLANPLQVDIQYSQVLYAKDSTVIHGFLSDDDKWRMKVELHEIIPDLKKAIINKEDKLFYHHYGVDPVAIFRAIWNNTIQGKRTSGASTITMQVARLLEPKDRTIGNKIHEMLRACQLEFYYSKDEILQMYLNLVPYGGNIEGVKSASVLFFDKLPEQLSPAEITTLAIVPNRPTSLRLGRANGKVQKERNKWLNRFKEEEVFSNEQIETALTEPLEVRRLECPRITPHFAYRIRRKLPYQTNVITSIDLNLQEKISDITSNYVKRQKVFGIYNSAIVVIENSSRKVVAYLGSNDFNDAEHFGQVDGVNSIRSPGSTLKPLVYASAIDKGLITPKTIITDVPTDFGDYHPENFNEEFNGTVTVEDALAFSLNVPAVKVLDQLGVQILSDKLVKAGFKQIKSDQSKLGLSLALGGCGVTLEELGGLYSSFANDGYYKDLVWTANDTGGAEKPLVSDAAAYLITKILTKPERPDLPSHYQYSHHLPKVAWKTGTSYGRKDAWSIGFNNKYTVGVWIGNFSGDGRRELTGSTRATPLLFEIFNIIDYNSKKKWFKMPKSASIRYVCEETGKVPDHFCTNHISDYYIPGVSSDKKCSHMKEIYISADEEYSYCTTCLPSSGYKKVFYPNHPPELVTFFKENGVGYDEIPEHLPSCPRIFHEDAPIIISPTNKSEYIVDKDDPAEIMLSCHVHNEVDEVHWYVNDKFLMSAKPSDKVFFKPPIGKVKISCSDDKGRNSNLWIQVLFE